MQSGTPEAGRAAEANNPTGVGQSVAGQADVKAASAARPALAAIGAVMVDVSFDVARLPRSGEGIVPAGVKTALGGCALNAVAAARKIGCPMRLLAPLGSGVFASIVRDGLREADIEPLAVDAGAAANPDNGACMCLVEPDGQRTMITVPGIERCFEKAWFDALAPADVAALRGALACGYELETAGGDAILGFFEAHPHIRMFYAPGPRVCDVSADRLARIRSLGAIWHLNDQEICAFAGAPDLREAGMALVREYRAPIVVTAGADGSYAFVPAADADAPARIVHVPTKPIEPVSTVGAGDAHLGAFAAAWSQGAAWEDALAVANRIAAEACLA
ncbi:PfkB family carbohydrate kinase [Xiamenia xianingshaonis]|uniref:PfkB family carbohydrate kinase n=1 Tax=Xiamenia xianingshaonis TaxID=2682776 RepID=UPI00140B1E2B|nr:PfkB family carbohydrate kinase [Xiamenia xianingshaonis]